MSLALSISILKKDLEEKKTMATSRVDSYAFFKNQEGWKAENRPIPYNSWANSTNSDFCSSYNTSNSHMPTKLNAFCIRALLSIVDRKNAEIGICRITSGSYASQWARPDGTVILASAQANGALTAAIREQTGRHKTVPGLGNKDTNFDPSSILALFILIEADRSRANGNDRSITWEMIEGCRKEFESTGVMPEDVVNRVNDALYYGLTYENGIPCGLKNGNISLLTTRRIDANEFASAEVICGNPDILVPAGVPMTATAGKNDIASAKAEFADYAASRVWTAEEEDLIPVFPEEMPVPAEVMTFARRFVKSREFKVPINNMCWRGGTGFGKSTGAEILACILHTPFVRITCSSQTELNDFLSQFVPNPDTDSGALAASLPTFEEIKMDPVGAYEVLTGKIDESIEADAVMKARDEALVARSNASHFKLVVSPFVTALEKGWIVEPSEFGRIRDSATLVGLNNFDKPGSRIPLPTGGYVRRHHDAMVLWTDNVGYNSSRPVDPSFMRRMDFVIDSYELPRERALERIKLNTGFDDDQLLDEMYQVWEAIKKYCKDRDITEGDISIVELERWVQLVMIEGESAITDTCREAVVSKACSDPETLQEIMDGCVATTMAALTTSI